jgi:CubicO group peptidase (beta-lactamase class C family)
MSNATSIVGTWSGFVSWGDAGPPVSNASTLWTFKADGSWSYLSFPQQALFDKIGIRTMRIETDPFGNFLGQGYEVGCGRDWARLGNLYLQDGVWNGERILPPGYAKFVSTPAPAWVADKRPIYGAFFWVNGAGQHPVPRDSYYMAGAGGQTTMIIPSHDLVVVRLGHYKGETAGAAAFRNALTLLMAAVPRRN